MFLRLCNKFFFKCVAFFLEISNFGDGNNTFQFSSLHGHTINEGMNTRWEKLAEDKQTEEKKKPELDIKLTGTGYTYTLTRELDTHTL